MARLESFSQSPENISWEVYEAEARQLLSRINYLSGALTQNVQDVSGWNEAGDRIHAVLTAVQFGHEGEAAGKAFDDRREVERAQAQEQRPLLEQQMNQCIEQWKALTRLFLLQEFSRFRSECQTGEALQARLNDFVTQLGLRVTPLMMSLDAMTQNMYGVSVQNIALEIAAQLFAEQTPESRGGQVERARKSYEAGLQARSFPEAS